VPRALDEVLNALGKEHSAKNRSVAKLGTKKPEKNIKIFFGGGRHWLAPACPSPFGGIFHANIHG
jgi:hypothetical protein